MTDYKWQWKVWCKKSQSWLAQWKFLNKLFTTEIIAIEKVGYLAIIKSLYLKGLRDKQIYEDIICMKPWKIRLQASKEAIFPFKIEFQISAKWILKCLNFDQSTRLAESHSIWAQLEKDANFISPLVFTDESWVHFYHPGTNWLINPDTGVLQTLRNFCYVHLLEKFMLNFFGISKE